MTTAEYIRKSLIASYLGNIVGALFVGLPALYMYLGDYHFTDSHLRNLENGNGESTPEGSGTVREVYRVETPKDD